MSEMQSLEIQISHTSEGNVWRDSITLKHTRNSIGGGSFEIGSVF
jgi:hypothetical protein